MWDSSAPDGLFFIMNDRFLPWTTDKVRVKRSVYYERKIKRELKRIHMSGCRYNERLKPKTDGSKWLTYTGLSGDLEHLTIETRLIGREFWVWWVRVWSRRYRWPIYVELNPQDCILDEDVSDLTLDLWGEHHTVKVEGWLCYLKIQERGLLLIDKAKTK